MPPSDMLSANPLPAKRSTTTISPPEEGNASAPYSHASPQSGAKLQGQLPPDDKPAAAKTEPFTLGEGLPVIPAKIVTKILRGEYVEMSELLQDNISLDTKLATAHSEGVSAGHLKASKKGEISDDVNGLLSWVECFNIYSTILLTKHPSLAKPLQHMQP